MYKRQILAWPTCRPWLHLLADEVAPHVLVGGSGPVAFGSPGWFRATDQAGYVKDDLTIIVPDCDDQYPEFTDDDLSSGQKHRGWVMFKDEDLKRGDSLTIGSPTGTKSAVVTLN